MKYQAILFDIDGVLLPIEPSWLDSSLRILRSYNIRVSRGYFLNFVNQRHGGNFALSINKIALRRGVYLDFKKLALLISNDVKKSGVQKDSSTVSLSELIKKYSKLIKMGIVSSRDSDQIKHIITFLGLSRFFEVIVTREDVSPDRIKPKPDQLLLACEKVSIEHSKAVFLGDTYDDALMAKYAGVDFIWVKPADVSCGVIRKISKFSKCIVEREILDKTLIKLINRI
jgi:phosphoglycolate phosphatase-like HAD superfamily hydrolase